MAQPRGSAAAARKTDGFGGVNDKADADNKSAKTRSEETAYAKSGCCEENRGIIAPCTENFEGVERIRSRERAKSFENGNRTGSVNRTQGVKTSKRSGLADRAENENGEVAIETLERTSGPAYIDVDKDVTRPLLRSLVDVYMLHFDVLVTAVT